MRRTRTLPQVGPVEARLRVDRLGVHRGDRPILSDVTFSVAAGELLALVGPNGAGKSTLLGAICGDLPPADGDIEFAGRPLARWAPVELGRLRAVLPQRTTMSFPFTVGEVVAMGRAPWAGTRHAAEDDDAVDEALRLTGMRPFTGRVFSALSGGEQARAALARVLAQRTPMLLLDEPTAALDLHHQELVLTLARERTRQGGTVVVVLHDLGLAAAYADRIALLAGGRLVADGPPTEVLTADRLSAVYQHEIEVLPHPRTGVPLVVPVRPPG
ncbi:heme ABC transporter ATP-binding protein [Micromonospora radicis]|uniref:Heme ABC transporter ATP-binding protein n=1 Tax=Micromonospora radicis TaxID=1894971 RepID=A0A418MW74_9ACTN|nr:heme ABC transporter ATP-binding protein [Micromonospora radicis]RIV39121.1 heme ABC transporter ATP-binding protein [Micromonospora radicis]